MTEKIKDLIKELKNIRTRISNIYEYLGNPPDFIADLRLSNEITILERKAKPTHIIPKAEEP